MTAKEMRKLLSSLAREYKLEYYIKREGNNLMTVRFLLNEGE